MKNNKTKKVVKYSTGGDILSGVSALSPLLNLVPGVGNIAAPIVGTLAGMGAAKMNQDELKNKYNNTPTMYNNTNAFGYEDGGSIQEINTQALQVTGAPNQVDGNSLNYKGTPIQVDYNEMIDTKKDRVFSDKYFNPLTGKKISEEVKSIDKAISKSEKKKNDPLVENTIKHLNFQKDSLFDIQEQIATLDGKRNTDGTTVQNNQQYNSGGGIDPMRFVNALQGAPLNNIPTLPVYNNNYVTEPLTLINDPRRIGYKNPLDITLSSNVPKNIINPVTGKTIQTLDYSVTKPIQRIRTPNSVTSKTPQKSLDYWMSKTPTGSSSQSLTDKGFTNPLTTGDTIQLAAGLTSMGLKAMNAFKKSQKEPYRTINSPITLQQLDPTNALLNSQNEYNSFRNDLQNRATSINTASTLAANAYAQKLNADNQIISNFQNQNKGLVNQYQQALANREAMNNQSMMQTDDLNSRNEANTRNMQNAFYNDIAGLGSFLGTNFNERLRAKMVMDSLKTMTPDVLENYLKNNPQISKYLQNA